MEAPGGTGLDEALVAERVASLVRVADDHDVSLSLEEVRSLLPAIGPDPTFELESWLREHPGPWTVRDGRLYGTKVPSPDQEAARRARSAAHVAHASRLFEGPLALVLRMTRCIMISGSTAFGAPGPKDDCDFLVVTDDDTLWLFTAYILLRLRVDRWRQTGPLPEWCFNYVLDEREARSRFGQSHGFVFAREALTVLPVHGERFYRDLVRGAPWLREQAPGLYDRWIQTGPELAPGPTPPAPLFFRLVNRAIYPFLAAYMQISHQRENDRRRRSGRTLEMFRSTTTYREVTFHSEKYARLEALYAGRGGRPAGRSPSAPNISR
ncbi:MAG: hypothetical protein L3K03_08760 [Thermoplasmata archaeon]|nr:hypothetical protein [Thermoplasmata archaeon]